MEENPQILAEILARIKMDSHNIWQEFFPWILKENGIFGKMTHQSKWLVYETLQYTWCNKVKMLVTKRKLHYWDIVDWQFCETSAVYITHTHPKKLLLLWWKCKACIMLLHVYNVPAVIRCIFDSNNYSVMYILYNVALLFIVNIYHTM